MGKHRLLSRFSLKPVGAIKVDISLLEIIRVASDIWIPSLVFGCEHLEKRNFITADFCNSFPLLFPALPNDINSHLEKRNHKGQCEVCVGVGVEEEEREKVKVRK